jgi:DNA modification methylase
MIIHGDCIEQMKFLPDCSIDSIVTDPPYELGFMNKGWDSSGIAYNVNVWRECFRLLKPGGHLLSFGGTRTYHRMAVAIEDAGFEIRDQINWVYGSGFPKSLDISKAIDKQAGVERKVVGKYQPPGMDKPWNVTKAQSKETDIFVMPNRQDRMNVTAPATPDAIKWNGYGTALKPAHEPIVVARKPIEGTVANNVLKHGCGGLNIDASRISPEVPVNREIYSYSKCGGSSFTVGGGSDGTREYPAQSHLQGRFPANLIHDGSEEVVREFPQTTSGSGDKRSKGKTYDGWGFKSRLSSGENNTGGDSGSAARFFKSCPIDEADYACLFYCAKASKAERNIGCDGLDVKFCTSKQQNSSGRMENGQITNNRPKEPIMKNNHPTVKPLSLMRYLVRLVTPTGGTVLDPFAGSGTTIMAAVQEGFNGIGIEQDADHVEIARCRVEAVTNVEKQLSIWEGNNA